MKVSHILYKADNLYATIAAYRKNGFVVEYGKNKKPHNALIYFSEGPYLEIFHNPTIPKFIKYGLSLFGKKKLVERITNWEHAEEEFVAICLETDKPNMNSDTEIKNKRLDTKNRLLKHKVLFPDDLQIPFLMTYFNIDPKPKKGFVHPNGIQRIKSISFGTNKTCIPIIKELCDDSTLRLFLGNGVKNLVYE